MKKVLVTSALPYVNNVPHLGTLVCVLSADVFTRYLRLKGVETIYVLGTDEHGTTTETRAIKEGITPKQVCDKYARLHKKIYDWFECSPDCWGRSSSKDNAGLTKDIFKKLKRNGFIIEGEVEQAWCNNCGRFLSDRYIQGECPFCGYKMARGDQCEKCGKLLEPKQLVNPKCEVCGATPEFRVSSHLFIDLPKLEPKLREWIKKNEGKWSNNARTMTHAWLKEGLKPRCITRDLKWGISVPGLKGKVFYSWFDAPIAYIGITKENRADWREWWLNPDGVELVQFMGKDNIPFHTILFPASLIGTGDNYTLLNEISVNEYLNFEGGMFSKSKHIGVFGDDAINTGIPADVYRYYIMVNRPEKSDTEFSWRDFQDKNNHELVANLGNLINRTLSFISRFKQGLVPEPRKTLPELASRFLGEWRGLVKKIDSSLSQLELKRALREIMELSKLGNKFFQASEPWRAVKEEPDAANTALYLLANLVKDLAILIHPYMPRTSEQLRGAMGFELDWGLLGELTVKPGTKVGLPELLFRKIDDPMRAGLEMEFSGRQAAHPAAKLELRVAEILEAKPHPDADKLLILKINLGNEVRQLVAGLKDYYTEAELTGRKIVVVTNLEPAILRGEKSDGMLIAGVNDGVVKLVEPKRSEPGEPVYLQGVESPAIAGRVSHAEFRKARLSVKSKRVYSSALSSPEGPLRTKHEVFELDMPDGSSVE